MFFFLPVKGIEELLFLFNKEFEAFPRVNELCHFLLLLGFIIFHDDLAGIHALLLLILILLFCVIVFIVVFLLVSHVPQ